MTEDYEFRRVPTCPCDRIITVIDIDQYGISQNALPCSPTRPNEDTQKCITTQEIQEKMAPGINPRADPSKGPERPYGVPRRSMRMITMMPVITAAMPMRMPPTAVESPETEARWTDAESARAVAEAEAARRAPPKAASLVFMMHPF